MTSNTPEALTDADDSRTRRVAAVISGLLRWGVRVSLALFVAGTLLSAARGELGSNPADLSRLTGPDGGFPRRVDWLVEGVVGLRGTALIVMGLVFLIATPLMRVAVSIAVFAAQRDRAFTLITMGVLTLLVLSFALGYFAP